MTAGATNEPPSRGEEAGAEPPTPRDASGEEYNPGPATRARRAATVILLRGGDARLEVLLVRRTPHARFMGGVWVFPGGAIDKGDIPGEEGSPPEEGSASEAHALRAAAARELREEAAIVLADPGELVEFSRWITPAV